MCCVKNYKLIKGKPGHGKQVQVLLKLTKL